MAVKEMKQKPGLQYRGKLMSPAYKQWTSPSPVKREQNALTLNVFAVKSARID